MLQMVTLRPRGCAFCLVTPPLSGAFPIPKACLRRSEFHSKCGTWMRFIIVRSKQSTEILGLKVWKELRAQGNKLASMVSLPVMWPITAALSKERTPAGPASSNSGFQPWDCWHFGPDTSLLWGLSWVVFCFLLFWFFCPACFRININSISFLYPLDAQSGLSPSPQTLPNVPWGPLVESHCADRRKGLSLPWPGPIESQQCLSSLTHSCPWLLSLRGHHTIIGGDPLTSLCRK